MNFFRVIINQPEVNGVIFCDESKENAQMLSYMEKVGTGRDPK
jgi:hypothetical protein